MASLSGLLHRPLSTAAVVAVAAASTDLPDRFSNPKPSDRNATSAPAKSDMSELGSGLMGFSFLTRDWSNLSQRSNLSHYFTSPVASLPVIQTVYQYAKISEPKDIYKEAPTITPSSPSSNDVMYRWHLPNPNTYSLGTTKKDTCFTAKSKTVVVLFGWLGAKQRHLKRYADWYTSRGYHAITFTFPMSDIMSYKVGGKAEGELEMLASQLADWAGEEGGKNLVFHTFSNTGWLTYGVVLEKFRKQDPSVMERIKGCIVDSAPVAAPDPQVWASGFSAAFLKKNSVATKGLAKSLTESKKDVLVVSNSGRQIKPAATEAALLAVLEMFFDVILNLPSINKRLSDVLDLLKSNQPKCPQLYIYSSADQVIPAKSVESFIERQRRAGHLVKSCDFVSSPHVDHFRNNPELYTAQLTHFLENCALSCCEKD